MYSYFLSILKERTNATITVQLLQTLSILFENIRNETSLCKPLVYSPTAWVSGQHAYCFGLDFLLSNNYVNQIIFHKFDIVNEEILAYYVSFLKTLSFKLNRNTIHFFFNEHLNDFPLYTEAIKFFNHTESMIRVAVRTITFNVYQVDEPRVRQFILDRTATPYFSNLVWFIGSQSLALDALLRARSGMETRSDSELTKIQFALEEHLDHLFYLNDILRLGVPAISSVLRTHLIEQLIKALYVASIQHEPRPEVSADPLIADWLASYLVGLVLNIFAQDELSDTVAAVLLSQDDEDGEEGSRRSSSATGTADAPSSVTFQRSLEKLHFPNAGVAWPRPVPPNVGAAHARPIACASVPAGATLSVLSLPNMPIMGPMSMPDVSGSFYDQRDSLQSDSQQCSPDCMDAPSSKGCGEYNEERTTTITDVSTLQSGPDPLSMRKSVKEDLVELIAGDDFTQDRQSRFALFLIHELVSNPSKCGSSAYRRMGRLTRTFSSDSTKAIDEGAHVSPAARSRAVFIGRTH